MFGTDIFRAGPYNLPSRFQETTGLPCYQPLQAYSDSPWLLPRQQKCWSSHFQASAESLADLVDARLHLPQLHRCVRRVMATGGGQEGETAAAVEVVTVDDRIDGVVVAVVADQGEFGKVVTGVVVADEADVAAVATADADVGGDSLVGATSV